MPATFGRRASYGQESVPTPAADLALTGRGTDLSAALAERQARLRQLGRWIGRAAVLLLALGLSITDSGPTAPAAGSDLFGGDPFNLYAAVPAELHGWLAGEGVAVRQMPAGWGHHGGTTVPPYGIFLVLLLLAHIAFKWLIPEVRFRVILVLTTPIWFMVAWIGLNMLTGGRPGATGLITIGVMGAIAFFFARGTSLEPVVRWAMVPLLPIALYATWTTAYRVVNGQVQEAQALTVRKGVVSDRDETGLVPPDATVTDEPLRLKPAGMSDGEHRRWLMKKWVTPYHLRPETLAQPMRDQAHYVLAQQAYMFDDPDRAARHLRALAGVWRPGDRRDCERIGGLAAWAANRGHAPGAGSTCSAATPSFLPRHIARWLLLAMGCLTGTIAICLCHLSQRLERAKTRAAK